MKKFMKSVLAVFLTLALTSGMLVCFAASDEKEYYDYGSYVLLGDSVASGYSDITKNDTEFIRVEGSYGAYVADALGVEYIPMACPAFRTVEMRYIFEDDFEPDRFIFYSAHDKEVMRSRIPEIRQAVADAGLITLGIGGNDWGTYVGWHIYEEMDKQSVSENFFEQARECLENAEVGEDVIESLIDIADLTNALPDLIEILPKALETGFNNFFTNWNYVIEDIYALNPDVTLLVIGMFDNMVRSEEDVKNNEAALLKLSVSQAIVDLANTPMIEGAEKYGYTFVDTTGTICEEYHPSPEGHKFIAEKILKALPDARFPYTDVALNSNNYKAIEYMYQNGIMAGISETEFAPDSALTNGQLSDALYNIAGVTDVVDTSAPDGEVTVLNIAMAVLRTATSGESDFNHFIKSISLALNIIFDAGIFNINNTVTRAQGAGILMDYINL